MNSTPHTIAADYAALFPGHGRTPLLESPALAQHCGVARIFVKDEGERPYGNFKILGGMLAALRLLAHHGGFDSIQALLARKVNGPLPRLHCASDGNHGLAVALAAQRAGTAARIFLPHAVNRDRAMRIRICGADIVWVDGTYDDAVDAANQAALDGNSLLVADTATCVGDPVVHDVMDGYGLIMLELGRQFWGIGTQPTHVFVQAGVGGLAGAMANRMREIATVSPHLVVVEPETAPCVGQALLRGEPVQVGGELVSTAEMLACGLASAPAVAALRRYGTKAIAVGDDTLRQAVAFLHKTPGLQTTPSGAAGLAGLLDVAANSELRHVHGLDHESRVLLLVTERTVCPGDDSRFAKLGLMRAEPDRNNRPLFG